MRDKCPESKIYLKRMKAIILALFLTALAITASHGLAIKSQFEQFKMDFSKKYQTTEEVG